MDEGQPDNQRQLTSAAEAIAGEKGADTTNIILSHHS